MIECYMCTNPKTSIEHVPPKCLFPEKKDLPPGDDLRKQLITVPSCDIHNSHKAKDDEYLFFALAMNILSNSTGFNHFRTKVMRAIIKNPSLLNKFLETSQHVYVKNDNIVSPSIAFKLDGERLFSQFDHIGRAIYFHHFKVKWSSFVNPFIEFLMYMDGPDSEKVNNMLEDLRIFINTRFTSVSFYGNNPEVFKYQVIKDRDNLVIFRLHFYEDAKVTLFLTDVEIPNPHGI